MASMNPSSKRLLRASDNLRSAGWLAETKHHLHGGVYECMHPLNVRTLRRALPLHFFDAAQFSGSLPRDLPLF